MPDHLNVRFERCDSCIFGPNSPVSPERFAELRASWEQRANEKFQICHQTYTANGDEDDEEPPDDLAVCGGWYEEFYVKRGLPVAIIQIAERLGKLRFVP